MLLCCAAFLAEAAPVQIDIYSVNDLHGRLRAAENAPGQYGKQDGKHGEKKSRDKGSGDQRYRRTDKGIKPQEKV